MTTTGVAAGVPYVAVPPSTPRPDAPVVLVWHLLDSPRTERAMAAALPLADLDAWRVYLGLPLSGSRLPEGGLDALFARAMEDVVRNAHRPIALGAVEELPASYAALREQLGLGTGPVALVGGSLGAAVAQLVLLEAARPLGLDIVAAVLVSPVVQLREVLAAIGRELGEYVLDDDTAGFADRLDFVARAGEFPAAGQPAVRIVVGSEDDLEGFLAPAQRLRDELAVRYEDPDRLDLVTVAGMGHGFAEEPGLEPAPQTECAEVVDGLAVAWLARFLDS
ncbi:alpha/beta hydrolase [Motilibacter deserti]|uniref:Alpha/beta hydrolase n=1 Tax=Motilibacter deserti TaxID=2714956 RepID=A0ABX0GZY2_9ACTN|nr:alpha/beta hydrolase [Motilibacter deserti]NHC15666.1 alpha/beta hydrolase [Motilibacter deserti]